MQYAADRFGTGTYKTGTSSGSPAKAALGPLHFGCSATAL